MIEGVIDLAFETAEAWVVIDFKIDRELFTGMNTYRRQLALYAAAIQQAVEKEVKAILVTI